MTDAELREKREQADLALRGVLVTQTLEETIEQIKKDLIKPSPMQEGTTLRVTMRSRTQMYWNEDSFEVFVFVGGKWHGTDASECSHERFMGDLVEKARTHIVSLEIASEWKPIEL